MKRLWTGILGGLALLWACSQSDHWKLVNTAVDESSGIAASSQQDKLFWTHNDSGDGPNLYAFDREGKNRGTFRLLSITVSDCEDMTLMPRPNAADYLYLGDIGDNARRRQEIIVYRLEEPKPDSGGGVHGIVTFDKFRLRYPDRAHDCETLMVHPTTGDLYLVTKEFDGRSKVYKLASPTPSEKVQTLALVATLNFNTSNLSDRLATGGDISTDGRRVVIRSYVSAYEYTLPEGQPFDSIFQTTPRRVQLPAQPQGEAICYTPDSQSWMITSEGTPCTVMEIKR